MHRASIRLPYLRVLTDTSNDQNGYRHQVVILSQLTIIDTAARTSRYNYTKGFRDTREDSLPETTGTEYVVRVSWIWAPTSPRLWLS